MCSNSMSHSGMDKPELHKLAVYRPDVVTISWGRFPMTGATTVYTSVYVCYRPVTTLSLLTVCYNGS